MLGFQKLNLAVWVKNDVCERIRVLGSGVRVGNADWMLGCLDAWMLGRLDAWMLGRMAF